MVYCIDFYYFQCSKRQKKPANRNRNAGTTQSCPVQKPRTQPTAAQTVKKQQTPYGAYKQSKAKPAASTTKYSDTKRQKASEQRAQQLAAGRADEHF
ncbi:MAG: hypothetical protein ACLUD0_20765 [Eubacterium ramulus]